MVDNVKNLKEALKKLDPKNTEAGLPGREEQNDHLYHFIFQRLKIRKTGAAKRAKREAGEVANIRGIHNNKTIFLCGVPGTGKTATVMRVLDNLQGVANKRGSEIRPFKRAYINGLHLQSPDKVYCEMSRQFIGKNTSIRHAQELLDSLFLPGKTVKDDSLYYIAVIDELDVLYNGKKNSVLYSLFDWPTSSDSRLILIVIANAIDLADRFMRGRTQSRMGWEKLLFESYTTDCLVNIVRARLGMSLMNKCFQDKVVLLTAMRVSRSTGDARRVLDLCRLAIDRAIKNMKAKVTLELINQVATENIDAFKFNFVKQCSLLQTIILQAIYAEYNNVSESNVLAHGVYTQLNNLLMKNAYYSSIGFVLYEEEFEKALNNLAAESIIHLESSKTLMRKRLFIKDSSDSFKELIHKEAEEKSRR